MGLREVFITSYCWYVQIKGQDGGGGGGGMYKGQKKTE